MFSPAPDTHRESRWKEAHAACCDRLLAELTPEGHWVGELSSSALSTATAVTALATVDRQRHAALIQGGLAWLAEHANADGGWGDTTRSRSNLSTSALGWAAFGAAKAGANFAAAQTQVFSYITRTAGSVGRLVPTIEARYGKDRTFSVPITLTLALSGRLGPEGWRRVRRLPFELAALPRGLFGALRLPVVSYALPALIAIGQAVQHHRGGFNPLRMLNKRRTLNVLATLQPENGGFLEATPLTSFVTMSLASMGLQDHIVARRGAEFLRASVRPDGSWPIDTNLATWVTTLSIKALGASPARLQESQRDALRTWLLKQQYRKTHAYTGAAPGGWAWTDLPGGVPDADDTAGALLALDALGVPGEKLDASILEAAAAGVEWLLGLQNGDGGMPTFCRGWGTLPFDRSTPELTAHAIRAWRAWESRLDPRLQSRLGTAIDRSVRYLTASQHRDGRWVPLWFGNEHAAQEENPVYGTAQVLIGLAALQGHIDTSAIREKAATFLRKNQNADGGWGGAKDAPSSLEETALATEALTADPASAEAAARGADWLASAVAGGRLDSATPIGLYFARLWYFERLYPIIFATSALGRVLSKRG